MVVLIVFFWGAGGGNLPILKFPSVYMEPTKALFFWLFWPLLVILDCLLSWAGQIPSKVWLPASDDSSGEEVTILDTCITPAPILAKQHTLSWPRVVLLTVA